MECVCRGGDSGTFAGGLGAVTASLPVGISPRAGRQGDSCGDRCGARKPGRGGRGPGDSVPPAQPALQAGDFSWVHP